jgi:hypothetical protein
MSDLGKSSIGITDGGNENGCGKIHEIISFPCPNWTLATAYLAAGVYLESFPLTSWLLATTSNPSCASVRRYARTSPG